MGELSLVYFNGLPYFIKMKKERKSHSSLEKEVIFAVTILYFLMMGAILAMHYLQPSDQTTVTSSSSPAHEDFGAELAPDVNAKRKSPHVRQK